MFSATTSSSLFLLAGLTLFSGIQLGAQGKTEWKAPSRAKRKKSPLTPSAETIQAGKALYLSSCMVCHGTQGKGDGPAAAALKPKPRDLTDPAILKMSDGELYWKIRTGKAPMPAFATALKSRQIWEIITFLRDLEQKRSENTPIKVPNPKAATHRVLVGYLDLLRTLKSKNWAPSSRMQAKRFEKTIASLRIAEVGNKKDQSFWLSTQKKLKQGASLLADPKNKNYIEGFQQITRALDALMDRFGNPEKKALNLFVCKMGPSKGGNLWFQESKKALNPFPWGSKMPSCGERLKTYSPPKPTGKTRTTK
ncbi:MAG TPA: DUF3347 domain-containing protein [Planctomycetes bacterium]|nr:DUF3347 domain-containing protein [Planctomycetota bacterium]